MSDELRPCPFCGFDEVVVRGNELRGWYCECPKCWGGVKDHCDSESSAAEDWNNRPVEDALRAKWQSVPWAALHTAIWLMASYLPGSKEADYDALIAFVESNAPKEPTE